MTTYFSKRSLRPTAVVSLTVAAMLLAGCHSTAKAAAPTPAATTPTTAAPASAPASAGIPSGGVPSGTVSAPAGGGTDVGAGPVSTANMRISNFFAPKGQPGPGLDIYDVQLQGQAATPILTNIAYGTISNYVHPHQIANSIEKAVELTALPTGEDPVSQKGDASQIGGLIDDGSGAQATILLTADSDQPLGGPTSLLGILSTTMRMEKGDDGQGSKGPAAPAITTGGGELLVDSTSLPGNLHPSLYLMIDKSCAPPLNGDPNMKGVPEVFAAAVGAPASSFAIFATSAGTHQVSIVAWIPSTAPTCKQLTKLQSTASVDVTANQQIEVYVYGTALNALHIAFAPIQA